MSLRPKRRNMPRVDVIPLIDVLMVLILFFLTSMQFQDLRALNVKLPKIDSAGSNKITNQLLVSITKEGEYFLNGNEDNLDEIRKVMKSSALLPRKPAVLVVADEDVPLKYVTEVVDLCRESGLDDFRLQSR
ncbi:biopolymer transporter ExbD [Opitutales bacterium]|nr:biopolymer transporter ExbD [Opitutales bacterium]MDG1173554.1 biopolymer transporter ExbD [Opitutales bacterium]